MQIRLIIFAFLAFSIVACSSSKSTSSRSPNSSSYEGTRSLVKFEHGNSLSAVLEVAKRQNKPVFIDFYTTWCTPCKLMDNDVFTHQETANLLNQNFINYKVNAEKGNGPDLATLYNVKSFPTLIFIDENGKVIGMVTKGVKDGMGSNLALAISEFTAVAVS